MAANNLISVLDEIQEEFPALRRSALGDNRVYLASIARGYRVMKKYGGLDGTPEKLSDEWLCGNDTYAGACNNVRALVGEAETGITRRIIAVALI